MTKQDCIIALAIVVLAIAMGSLAWFWWLTFRSKDNCAECGSPMVGGVCPYDQIAKREVLPKGSPRQWPAVKPRPKGKRRKR